MTTSTDTDPTRSRPEAPRWGLGALMPKGLYTRSLLIVIVPILLLQTVVAAVFMERHWDRTTRRLSTAVVQDVAVLVDLRKNGASADVLQSLAAKLDFTLEFLPAASLPAAEPTPFFHLVETALYRETNSRISEPVWIDARTLPKRIDMRVQFPQDVMRITTSVDRAYAPNAQIFLIWMVVASALLLTIAVLFLRNQIRPILQLADAAENLGKGRDVADFRPRGAQEVRRATQAFFAMRDRIQRQIEQRTTMLAGVSHDLRTVLTRLKLQLAFIPQGQEREDMAADIGEMERMLEGYLAFARGDAGELARPIDVAALLKQVGTDAGRAGKAPKVAFSGEPIVIAKPDALKRAVANLVTNAYRFGKTVRIEGAHEDGHLVVTVDDDGPGVPEDLREDVFRPFLRLDQARNLDHPGSGLGLTIARDIARGHGGDVELFESPLGGLRAKLHIPA